MIHAKPEGGMLHATIRFHSSIEATGVVRHCIANPWLVPRATKARGRRWCACWHGKGNLMRLERHLSHHFSSITPAQEVKMKQTRPSGCDNLPHRHRTLAPLA